MKKALIWTTCLILFEVVVSTIVLKYFDVIGFAEKYNEEIVHGILAIGLIYFVIKKYKKLRFKEKKQRIVIQLLEG